jgi:hypothetical protein
MGLGHGFDSVGLNYGRNKRVVSSPKHPNHLWGPPSQGVPGFPRVGKVARLCRYPLTLSVAGMNVVIPLLPLYACMVWTGTALPFNSRQDVRLVLSAWHCVMST